jgi:hypothetical protein
VRLRLRNTNQPVDRRPVEESELERIGAGNPRDVFGPPRGEAVRSGDEGDDAIGWRGDLKRVADIGHEQNLVIQPIG